MFFKFKENDLYVNRIKAHPRVNFFIHSGTIHYNNRPNIPKPDGTVVTWAFLNGAGNFSANTLAAEVNTARANNDSIWALSIFKQPAAGTTAPHWAGRNIAANGKWGQRLEGGEVRSWVQRTTGASPNLVFDVTATGPVSADIEMLLTVDSGSSGGTGTFSWYTSDSTLSLAAYTRSLMPSDFDRYAIGGRDSGGSVDIRMTGFMLGHVFGRGEAPSAGDITAIRAAFTAASDSSLTTQVTDTIRAAIASVPSGNVKFASLFASGSSAISGSSATEVGTITYTVIS